MSDGEESDRKRIKRVAGARMVSELFDGIDEDRAKKLRGDLGLKGWIISWSEVPGGLWLARVSTAQVGRTVERVGRTRIESISRAVGTLGFILELQSHRRSKLKEDAELEDPGAE